MIKSTKYVKIFFILFCFAALNIFILPSLSLFSQIQPQDPDPAAPLIIEGNQYAQQGFLDEALKRYNKALELNPENTLALIMCAQVKYWMWDYKGAIKDYTNLIEKNPINDNFYLDRGLSYMYFGYVDKAIEDWTQAIKLKPKDNPAYLYRACLYKIKGKERLFKKDYDVAIRYYKSEAYFYNHIASFIGLNLNPNILNVEIALEYASKAFEMTGGKDTEVLYTLAELYFQKAFNLETKDINKYDVARALNYMINIFKQQGYLKTEMNGYYLYRYDTMHELYDKINK